MKNLATVAALLIVMPVTVEAHETWLLPRQFAAAPNGTIVMDFTSGMSFPKNGTAIKPDRVVMAKMRTNGQVVELTGHKPAANSLVVTAKPSPTHASTIWIQLRPRTLELTRDQVGEYLDELDASTAFREAWKQRGPKTRWRESYIKHAKTMIATRNDDNWNRPVGLRFEIVPETNPASLKENGSLPVRILLNDMPLADQAVGLAMDNSIKKQFQKTDALGRVRFTVPSRGRLLLYATHIIESKQPNLEWESDFTTLTLEVSQ